MESAATALSAHLPTEAAIKAAATVRDLEQHDEALAKIALLWRECEMPWAATLAAVCAQGRTAEQLFQLTDEVFWAKLQDAARANELKMVRERFATNSCKRTSLPVQTRRRRCRLP